jgi:hypothetical protein
MTTTFAPFLVSNMSLFGSRQSTRDIAVAAAQTISSHIEDCGRRWTQAEQTLRDLQMDFDKKHNENQKDRKEDRDSFDRFQKKLLVVALVVMATIVFKGTNVDFISHILSNL